MKTSCPLCLSKRLGSFYTQKEIPVFNNVVYRTKEEAINCEKGKISLTLCSSCGLIFNSRVDTKLLRYREDYDSDRSYSEFYCSYLNNIVELLTDKYEIGNKKILEIGCGDGRFLKLLCKQSNSRGVGIDPAYKGKQRTSSVSFIKDYFSAKHRNIEADVCVLRHILEHIERPSEFLNLILDNLRFSKELTIIVEVPDFEWISREGSFWDITYEHCNYFTKKSLVNLFELNNISMKYTFNTFSDQYILVVGQFKAGTRKDVKPNIRYKDRHLVPRFLKNSKHKSNKIASIVNNVGFPFTIWGVSGKGVIFINSLGRDVLSKIPFVIDINKEKQGKYCPGTGHRILPHSILKSNPAKDIIVMNPNYYHEISDMLKSFNKRFNLITI